MDQDERPGPPDFEWRAPDCPFCGEELACDSDSLWCETKGCGHATWSHDGEGEWIIEGPQCTSEQTVEFIRTVGKDIGKKDSFTWRCTLTVGHEGTKHINGDFGWEDGESDGQH